MLSKALTKATAKSSENTTPFKMALEVRLSYQTESL